MPLVVGPDGTRLAKRHGAGTLAALAARGTPAGRVLAWIGASLGACAPDVAVTADDLVGTFDLAAMPREPWRLDPATLSATIAP